MSDNQSVIIISKIMECRRNYKCNYNCSDCCCNYSDKEMFEALSRATDSLLERSKDE